MRQRNWTFYKINLYVGLTSSIGLIGLFGYNAFFQHRTYWRYHTIYLFLVGALLQTVFYILCLRLVHYYLYNRQIPNKSFSFFFTILLVFNSCVAIGSLLLLAFGFSETFLKTSRHPAMDDYLALTIIGGFTFTTMYISSASIVLRRYNRYQVATDEEKWLSQLGTASLNQ